jgi:hypothetical protein
MAAAAEETKNQLSRVGELLKRKGYDVDEPPGGWTWVTVERFAYLVAHSENDSDFYQLVFPMRLDDNDTRKDEYLYAINATNVITKLAKAFLGDDNHLNIVVDVVASGPDEFVANFTRYVSAIQTSLKLFNDKTGG